MVSNKRIDEYSEEDLQIILNEFLTDDSHHLILKTIPKTGCTSWRTLVLQNSQSITYDNKSNFDIHSPKEVLENTGIYSLSKYNRVAILNRLNSYLIMLTVRHPLARIESAFTDLYIQRHGIKINELNESINQMFETYLKGQDILTHKNRHFATYTDFSNPCIIPYK